MIVPYPAGGSTDVLFRILAEKLKDKLGQTFTVENRPGRSGNIGIDQVVKSAPDGYTIGCATVGHFAINQYLIANMPFNAEKGSDRAGADLRAAERRGGRGEALSRRRRCRVHRLGEGAAERNFDREPRSRHHAAPLRRAVRARTGIKAVHVPFKGASQTIPAMLSGDVNFAVDNLASYVSQIESGNMRALAVTSAQRWPTMPNVPTMAEAGVKDFVVTSWSAYVVPTGTPRAMVDRLSAAHKEIAADKAMQKRFLDAGARILSSTPEEAKPSRPRKRKCVAGGGADFGIEAAVNAHIS